jgi:Glycosyltransferase family 87
MDEATALKTRPSTFQAVWMFALVLVCGLCFGFTAYVFVLSLLPGPVQGSRDFVAFWATGQLLAHHANPYDATALLQLERAAGFPAHYDVMYMLNPPWNLPLVYPLGFLNVRAASILWSLLQTVCFTGSVYMLWVMQGRPRGTRQLLGYSFAPALICLIMGQLTLFALFGLVLFLWLYRTSPFLAGMSLWFCLLKPHLLLPFGIVMLVWIFVSRNFRIFLGAIFSVVATGAIALYLDPQAWSQYLVAFRHPGGQYTFVPCVSVLLRIWISRNTSGLEYIPAIMGVVWGLVFFWPRRTRWDWRKEGSLLIVVSVLVAPYAWLYDQALVLPALMHGVYATRSRNLLVVLMLLTAVVEFGLIAILWKPAALYTWTLWSAPAWVAWYLLATRANNLKFDPAAR